MKTARINRVAQGMRQAGLRQILVSSPASLYYLTGLWIHPGERMAVLWLNDRGDCCLVANRLFALRGQTEARLVEYDDTQDCIQALCDVLEDSPLGIDKDWPSRFTLGLMAARPALKVCLGSAPVDAARLCKDAEEIALMRESSRRNDAALAATIRDLRRGMTEQEGCRLYLDHALRQGGQGTSFDPLVCYGANCAEPHHGSDAVTCLREGDAVILDVGLLWQDYASDMTRTVFAGQPSAEQQRVYALVQEANAAGRAAVRPGVPLSQVDRAARKVIEDGGYGPYFIHRTGHNIGLEVHEKPDVSATGAGVCLPGMVFSVEPGIYLPGRFGVRVEDLVLVTEDGAETLNALPRELQII